MNASNSASTPAVHTPKIGEVAPDFELPDSTGALRELSELTARGPLVLLFYRGHW
jgi:peroxiredoxin